MADSTNSSDFEEHKNTYHMFVSLLKWNVLALAVLLVLLYFFVNP